MEALFLVDAAPGFENSVQSALEGKVKNIVRAKIRNNDFIVAMELPDESAVEDALRHDLWVSGVKGVERVEPAPEILAHLS